MFYFIYDKNLCFIFDCVAPARATRGRERVIEKDRWRATERKRYRKRDRKKENPRLLAE